MLYWRTCIIFRVLNYEVSSVFLWVAWGGGGVRWLSQDGTVPHPLLRGSLEERNTRNVPAGEQTAVRILGFLDASSVFFRCTPQERDRVFDQTTPATPSITDEGDGQRSTQLLASAVLVSLLLCGLVGLLPLSLPLAPPLQMQVSHCCNCDVSHVRV